jgi:Fe-S cluster assembly ATPase SufC
MRFSNGHARTKITIFDETDSGLDIDALRIVMELTN